MIIDIKNIRNIKSAYIDFPMKKGMYAFIGENGSGKSTLMLLLSLLVKKSSKDELGEVDLCDDSYMKIVDEDKRDTYYTRVNQKTNAKKFQYMWEDENTRPSIQYKGFYEGSIYYGSRFYDFEKTKEFMATNDFTNDDSIREADDFVKNTLSNILHGNTSHYKGLFKLKSKKLSEQLGFSGIPYFLKISDNRYISQFAMSSGESMLVRLIDFVNNLIVNSQMPENASKMVFIIDEVELALHPSATVRLVDFFKKLIEEYESKHEIIVIFSTHSSEVINKISPKNIYLIENREGTITTVNPCYPNYGIRQLYIPNGFDFLLLVEDELSKIFVNEIIRRDNLTVSKLKIVIPCGGYSQTLSLHKEIVSNNVLGVGKKVISLLDGDCVFEVGKFDRFKDLPKLFLPIPSIEKFLFEQLILNPNRDFIKNIGDKYFNQRSLNDIINDYINNDKTNLNKQTDGKALFKILISNLKNVGISEEKFTEYLSQEIFDLPFLQQKIEDFRIKLENMLN